MTQAKKHGRSKGQWFFIILAAVAFTIIIATSKGLILETFELLKQVNLKILFILPLMQFISYMFVAGYYKSALKIFKHDISFPRAYGTVISLYFVEQVLPSGGASGMSYIAYALRTVASPGMTTIVQISRYLFSYGSYVVVVPTGIMILLASKPLNKVALWQGVALSIGIVLIALLIRYLLESRRHIDAFVKTISRFVNRIAKKFFDKKELLKADAIERNLIDFHDGAAKLLRSGIKKVFKPFLFMLTSSFIQLSIVYLAFVAVGQYVNLGVIIMAFALANIAGVISVIPGDVGVHETVMTFVLSTAGVPAPVALSATLLYRIFNKLVILPIGFLVYTQYLKPAGGKRE